MVHSQAVAHHRPRYRLWHVADAIVRGGHNLSGLYGVGKKVYGAYKHFSRGQQTGGYHHGRQMATQTPRHHNHEVKDKEQRIVSSDVLSGINASRAHVRLHGPVKGYVKGTFVRTNEAYSTTVTTAVGVQGLMSLCEIGSMQNFIAASTGFATFSDLAFSGYTIIPDTAKPAQTYYPAITDSTNQRFIMRHTELNMQFCNSSSASCTVKLFVCRAKQNMANNPTLTAGQFTQVFAVNYWDSCLNLEGMGKTPQTFLTTAGGVRGREAFAQPGANPQDSRTWKKMWHVEASHTMHLSGNGVEVVNLSIVNNQAVDVGKLIALNAQSSGASIGNAANSYNTGMLKGGYSVFAIVLGQPAKDASAGFTYAPIELGCVINRKISWAGLKEVANNYVSIQAESNIAALGLAPKILQSSQISSQTVTQA